MFICFHVPIDIETTRRHPVSMYIQLASYPGCLLLASDKSLGGGGGGGGGTCPGAIKVLDCTHWIRV